MKRKARALFCTGLAVILLSTELYGCADRTKSADEGVLTTTETTTVTTTETTTEDLSTTFPVKAVRAVYTGLKKDADGDYPYKIAEYSTHYNANNETRTANVRASAKKVNNIVVPDGYVFSFNQVVGKRTVIAGFEEASVIRDGEFVDGLGGGICQTSSTIFEAVLRANCKIVERTNHSLEVFYVPLGGDATVDWGSKDFQFKNNLGTDIRLSMTCSDGTLTCSVWAKEKVDVGEVKIDITQEGEDYILTRTVNGEKNYETKSRYDKPKESTTAAQKQN